MKGKIMEGKKLSFKDISRGIINNIFSIKNSDDKNCKIIRCLGLKIKKRRMPQKYKIRKDIKTEFSFPAFEKPIVSIIIPTYNQYKYTVKCLYSILNTVEEIPYEVIIADDCSTDETVNIEKSIKNIKFIQTDKNSGFLKNCNNASKYAKGEYLWLLNNDTQVLNNSLKSILETFRICKNAGAVGSKLIFGDISLQEAGGIIYSDATGCNFGRGDKYFYNKPEYNYLKEVDYCSGASLLIKKSLWEELGGFDEYFAPAYYEETDLCFRIRQKGLKVMYQPKSEIIHFESVSLKESHEELMDINRKKFCKKWSEDLQKQATHPTDKFFAKDRSYGKKVLLFSDEWLLKPDTNCGNRSSFQYLKMFADMGLNVKFVANSYTYNDFNSNDKKYADLIQQMGVEIISAVYFKDWIKKYGKYIDYIFVNRPHVWDKQKELYKSYCPKAITMYQGHDIHYLRESRAGRLENNPKQLKKSEIRKIQEYDAWNNADYIFYYSDKEINTVKEINPNAKAFSVPLYLYEDKISKNNYDAISRKDLVFVGGFSHTPNLDAMKWFVKDILPQIKSHIPDIKMYIVGSKNEKYANELRDDNIIITGFLSDEKLNKLYTNVRLSVVPLRFGAGVKGKIIEAIQNKIPVITTDIGAEGINNESKIITVANTSEEIASAIVDLYNNTDKLNEISAKSEDFIQKNFSLNTAKEIFEGILKYE